MANYLDKLTDVVVQRVEQRIMAALDPASERLCEACGGEGYMLADGGLDEQPCAVCGGSGLKEVR